MSMVLYILLYRITGHFVPHCPDKISVFPKFSTPQLSLHLRIPAKNLFRTYTLENPYHLSYRIFRRYAREYVDMILRYLHLHYFTVPRFQYLFKQFPYRISHLFCQYPLAVFRRPYKMVSRVINCMAQTFYAHAAYYTKNLNHWNPFLPVLPHGVSRVRFS